MKKAGSSAGKKNEDSSPSSGHHEGMILNLRRHPLAWDITPGRAYNRPSGALLIEVVQSCHVAGLPILLQNELSKVPARSDKLYVSNVSALEEEPAMVTSGEGRLGNEPPMVNFSLSSSKAWTTQTILRAPIDSTKPEER